MTGPSLAVPADCSATPESRWGAFPHARRLAALGLFALTLWTFFPAIENGFVGYDDPELVTENSHLQSGINWENVKWAFCTPVAANWHPMTLLSHMLDCQCFGLAPWGHHLTSVLGHALSAVLLFLALDRMTRATGCSFAVALLFALHPLRVESVAWVAERKDILSTFFGMLALYAYASYAARAGRKNPTTKWFYGLTLVAFVAALLSKPMLVTLPLVMLLLDYWPLQRFPPFALAHLTSSPRSRPGPSRAPDRRSAVRPNPAGAPQPRRLILGRLLLEKLPFLVISLALCIITYAVHSHAGDILTNLTLASRIENSLVSYSRYLGELFYPAGLSPFYPLVQPLPPGTVWGAGLLLATVTALALVVWRTRPYFVVGWFWYLGTLVPVIGLVQTGVESMADRYTYFPCIGLLLALVWGLHELLRRLRRRVAIEAAFVAVAGFCCIVITRQQITRWRDTETLFRHALAVTTGNYIAHNNLGTAFDKQGRFAEAAAEFRQAIKDKPDYAQAYNNLGIVLGEQGELDQATAQYRRAIELKPTYPNPYNNLGLVLGQQGRLDEAMRHFARALALQSEYADAHYNLAQALARAGRLNEAIEEYRQTLKLQPGLADVHNNLGVALDQQGRLQDAAQEYLQAIRLKPDYARAYFNLGVTLGKDSRIDEAIAAFEQALKLKPDYPAAQTNLAQLLEFKRHSPK